MTEKKITIKLNNTTGKRIKALRITDRESYDEIINRLLNTSINKKISMYKEGDIIFSYKNRDYRYIDLNNSFYKIHKLKEKLEKTYVKTKESNKTPTKKNYKILLETSINYLNKI